uniref:Tetratricopeptide repeat protein n=1 Tax=candidate division WOR-3 bacterium TaxID=2052148 RepID=A0A7V6CN58_UNCW3
MIELTSQSVINLLLVSFLLASPVKELILKGDECYLKRESLNKAWEAKGYYEEALRLDSNNYEAYWKLARVMYFLSDNLSPKEKSRLLKEGIIIARKAVKINPHRAEGHFWLAVLLGSYCQISKDFSILKEIEKEFQLALKIDSAIEDGSAYAALGRMYFKLPVLLGGSLVKAEEYLLKAKKICPTNPYTKLYLADFYLAKKMKEAAKRDLLELSQMAEGPKWLPEIKKLKKIAEEKLRRLDGKK